MYSKNDSGIDWIRLGSVWYNVATQGLHLQKLWMGDYLVKTRFEGEYHFFSWYYSIYKFIERLYLIPSYQINKNKYVHNQRSNNNNIKHAIQHEQDIIWIILNAIMLKIKGGGGFLFQATLRGSNCGPFLSFT